MRWIGELAVKPVEYIITLTANARPEEMEIYMSLGSDDYLSKPIEKEDLRRKIRVLKKHLLN